jgi:hypothetical protein
MRKVSLGSAGCWRLCPGTAGNCEIASPCVSPNHLRCYHAARRASGLMQRTHRQNVIARLKLRHNGVENGAHARECLLQNLH